MKFNNAIIFSLIAHVALVGLLVANFQFSKIEVKPSGNPAPKINAKAINNKRVEQLVEKLKQEKLSEQRKERKRLEDLKKAEDAAKQRRKEEEKKASDARKKQADAERKRKAEEKKAADLKKKRIADEKERKRIAEQEKKRKAEAERKRKAEEERKRKQKEEAEKKRKAEEERKRKAAEEKARQEALEREMMEQMEAEAAELQAAHQQQVMSEVDKFNSLIEGKIRRNWFKPEHPGDCTFRVRLAPGGLVVNIDVLGGDAAYCESGRRAILRAEPLPMSKDPDVFEVLKTRTFKLENDQDEE